ncbi:hypothetical protein [Prauserella sp. PE36]|nr:hypothetical protein [Prauserella sp. PE36]
MRGQSEGMAEGRLGGAGERMRAVAPRDAPVAYQARVLVAE